MTEIKVEEIAIIDLAQYGREKTPRVYTETSPTLTARDYKEPKMVLVREEKSSGDSTENGGKPI